MTTGTTRRRVLATTMTGFAWPWLSAGAQTPPPGDLAALFGPAVAAHPLAKAPFAELDLDGDGKPDRVWVVRLTRGGADALAKETRRTNPFSKRGLGARGEPLAIAIQHASGERWLIHDGELLSTPIWQASPLPLEAVKRGSKKHREASAAGAKPRGDLLLIGTEAGIDMALYWNGRGYAANAPKEEP